MTALVPPSTDAATSPARGDTYGQARGEANGHARGDFGASVLGSGHVAGDGYTVVHGALDAVGLDRLRAGVEAAAERACARLAAAPRDVTTWWDRGHCLQRLRDTVVHWEPGAPARTVRNLYPATHLDARLEAAFDDPRLAGPAAAVLGVAAVEALTSKVSYKRAGLGSEFIWHQDYTFLEQFLGRAAAEVVTVMVLLDDADAGNGALRLVPGSQRSAPRPDGQAPQPGDAEPVTVAAEAGSVIAFPSLMLHQSEPNLSARDRRALLLVYRPAGRSELGR